MENSNKRIIILTPGFPANEADTTCIPFQQSLLLQWKEDYPQTELIVLALQYPYHNRPYFWKGIQVIPFKGRNKGGIPRLLLREKIKRELKRLQIEKNIQGLLSFWYNETAWAGNWMSNKYGIPHYCWLWGQDAKKENPYPSRLKLKKECLIAISDSLQDRFEFEHKVRPFKVIPPGTRRSRFDRVDKAELDVLGVGSLIPLKNYELFIETINEVKKQFPNVRALIIGQGRERGRLEFLVKKYGLENNLQLAGELPHDEVLAKMRRSKIFLHPSSYEGFSIACLEAVQQGMQVISFVKPMNENILGWQIVNDATVMKEKTLDLLKNYAHSTGNDLFPIRATIAQLMNLY